jgi:predicted outer membrane repeat protein
MKIPIKKLNLVAYLFVSFIFLSVQQVAQAASQVCESTSSGDWSNAVVWSDCNGMYPGEVDGIGVTWQVIIKAGHAITLNQESINIHGLQMVTGSELIIGNTFSTVTINNSQEAWQSLLGQITLNTDNFIINTGSLNINFGLIDGAANMTINSTGTTFFNETIGLVTPLNSLTAATSRVSADIATVNDQTYTGEVTLSADIDFRSQSGSLIFNNMIEGGGFNLGLYPSGDYLLNDLNVSNVFRVTIDSSGMVLLNGNYTINSIILQNELKINQESILTLNNGGIFFNDIILNNSDFTINQISAVATFRKSILAENGGGFLTKTGPGTLNLPSDSESVNVPIGLSEGTLVSKATHSESIIASNDSILSGEFVMNDQLQMKDQSLFNVGNTNSVTGTTTVNDTELLGSDTTMEFFLNGPAAGSFHDQLVVTNNINLSGNIVATHPFYALSIGDSFTLIDNQSGNPINGTFTGLPEGKAINNGSLTISYVGGDGNDLVLTSTCLAQITVTSDSDTNENSLRQAVADICDGGTIDFDPSVTTINFASLIEIDKAITINGDGQILDGGNSTIIFKITNTGDLTANRLNINNAFGDGAIQNIGIVNIDEFNFNNNTQSNMSPGGGGAFLNVGQATITNSSFYQNNANLGGAVFNTAPGSMAIRNSSFYENGNTTSISGGSIFNNATMQIENSTLIDSGKPGIDGATIHNFREGVLTLENTVIQSSNVTPATPACIKNANVSSTITVINSFIDDGSCNATFSGDADLGPWAAEGGFGNTFTPNVQSPLINTGANGQCPAFDPLGTPRPFAGQCDIGAVEFSQYRVGVNVTGLASGNQVELQINESNNLIVDDNSTHYFPIAFDAPASYEATIITQPTTPDQICKFNNNISTGGTIVNTDVILDVDCTKNLIYVNASALTMGDGSSWATAFNNLQDALIDPDVGEIWVAAGVYYPDEGGIQIDNDKFATFTLIDGVSIYGGFDGTETSKDQRDPEANITILSGDIDADDLNSDGNQIAESTDDIQGVNAYQIVNATTVTPSTLLDGLTLTAGHASDTVDLTYSRGAAIYCGFDSNSPRLNQMKFIGNKVSRSGGATFGCATYVSNSSYINNYSGDAAGAVSIFEGGYFVNVQFQGNKAMNIGGAIKNNNNQLNLTNVKFIANSTTNSHGGAINTTGSATIENNLFRGNKSGGKGGGIYAEADNNLSILNVTMTGNKAIALGGAINNSSGSFFQIYNSIIWNNQDSSGQGTVSASVQDNGNITSISNSLVQGYGSGIAGNLDEDPLFMTDTDPTMAPTSMGNAHVMDISPTIDAGNNGFISTTTDLDGIMRVLNTTVDMGAYEYFDEQVFKDGFE